MATSKFVTQHAVEAAVALHNTAGQVQGPASKGAEGGVGARARSASSAEFRAGAASIFSFWFGWCGSCSCKRFSDEHRWQYASLCKAGGAWRFLLFKSDLCRVNS